MESKKQKNEAYLECDYTMFLSSQFMEKILNINTKHIKNM